MNEVGPTIQQGVIQHAVLREMQRHTGARPKQVQQTRMVSQNQRDDDATLMSSQDKDGGDRLPEQSGGVGFSYSQDPYQVGQEPSRCVVNYCTEWSLMGLRALALSSSQDQCL